MYLETKWNSKAIRKKYPNANIYMILAERTNGKSYDSKSLTLEHALLDYKNDKGRVFLLRRFESECTAPLIENYYNKLEIYGVPLVQYTAEEYNRVIPFRGKLYLGNGRKHDLDAHIGYYFALQNEQDLAGANITDIDNIVFEEFISRRRYLENEPAKLMNLYSTIRRDRTDVKLWLLGNPVGQYIPYYTDWGIDSYIRKMEQNTITAFYIPIPDKDGNYPHGAETKTRIAPAHRKDYVQLAVEYCQTDETTQKMAVGKHATTINNGAWQVDDKPKLQKGQNYKSYRLIYRLILSLDTHQFIAEFRVKNEEQFWFVYPKTGKEIKKKSRVISTQYNPSIRYTTSFQPRNALESQIFQQFNRSNVFFSDDASGTLFSQVAEQFLKIKI